MNKLFVAEIVENNTARFIFLTSETKEQAQVNMERICRENGIFYNCINITQLDETETHQILIGSPEETVEPQDEKLYFVRFDDLEEPTRFLTMVVAKDEEDVLLTLYKQYPNMNFQRKHEYECQLIDKVGDYPITLQRKEKCVLTLLESLVDVEMLKEMMRKEIG